MVVLILKQDVHSSQAVSVRRRRVEERKNENKVSSIRLRGHAARRRGETKKTLGVSKRERRGRLTFVVKLELVEKKETRRGGESSEMREGKSGGKGRTWRY